MKPTPSLFENDPLATNDKDFDRRAPGLTYPHHSIFGTTDFARLAGFFALFGYQPRKMAGLSKEAAGALYGLDAEAEQWLLRSPATDSPIRIVATPHKAEKAVPMQKGPYGIDIYSSDLKLTLSMVESAGFRTTRIVPYEVEGWPRREARALGPEEFTVFLIESLEQRFPSVLDREYWRAHSQVHMLCWIVDRIDEERRFWTEEAGLTIMRDVLLDPQAMVDLMDHPRPVRFGAVQVADPDINRRMELMHFVDDQVPRRGDWPLKGGFHGGAFRVPDLEKAMARMTSAAFGKVVETGLGDVRHRVSTGVSPGGVRFELWQPRD
ncbi:MAG: hypothetical protein AB7S92_16405 [Parvibaculaceae bacterium]